MATSYNMHQPFCEVLLIQVFQLSLAHLLRSCNQVGPIAFRGLRYTQLAAAW